MKLTDFTDFLKSSVLMWIEVMGGETYDIFLFLSWPLKEEEYCLLHTLVLFSTAVKQKTSSVTLGAEQDS